MLHVRVELGCWKANILRAVTLVGLRLFPEACLRDRYYCMPCHFHYLKDLSIMLRVMGRVGLLKGEHHTSGDLVGLALFLEARKRGRYAIFLWMTKLTLGSRFI